MADSIIIRYNGVAYSGNRRQHKAMYTTVEADNLTARFPEVTRVKRVHDIPGLGRTREIEGTGRQNRSHVLLTYPEGHSARGSRQTPRRHTIKLLEHKKHVRVLSDDDQLALALMDDEIAALAQKVGEARVRREEAVERAWKRAEPLGLDELERRAGA